MPGEPPSPPRGGGCREPGGLGLRFRGARGREQQEPTTIFFFAYPSLSPCFLGQEEVNRKPEAWGPFTFGSEV